MNWKLLLILGIACIGLAMAGLFHERPQDGGFELTILHTNDLHAHYDSFQPWGDVVQGGVARLKTVVDEIRDEEENTLLLDAGDQFQGTLFFTVGGAEAVADVMNEIAYDAMAVGNHEFDGGPAVLAEFVAMADFPILSANMDAWDDDDLAGLIPTFESFTFDGVSVAVIGLTTEHTVTASNPGPSIYFSDAVSTAQQLVNELTEMGFGIIVALTHLGTLRDVGLAQSVSGIDVVVGGHTHTLLEEYPILTTSASGEPVLVVTAHEWGKYLGRLDVGFSETGVIEGYGGEPIFIDETVEEDAGMLARLETYRPQIDALMSHVVGSTDVFLGSREDARAKETIMGNLICDAMIWKTADLGVTIAIQNGGGIRADIEPGEVTMGQILEVLPFGNQITVLTVTGEQLLAALENGVGAVEEGAGRFPQVAGMRYTFDSSLAVGARITAVEIWDATAASYAALDASAAYTIATNNYLAGGGDGYDYSEAADRYDTGWLLSDALAEYLTETGAVAPEIEGRITTIEQETETETTEP